MESDSSPESQDPVAGTGPQSRSQDVERVVGRLGEPRTEDASDQCTSNPVGVIARRFGNGSRYESRSTLGHNDTDQDERPSRNDDLIADVHRVADRVGGPPTPTQYSEDGEHSPRTIERRLGDESWVTALERLDYDVADGWDRIPDEILRDDVDRVAATVGRRPMVQEYDEHGSFAPITVSRRFGDGLWEKSMVTLGYDGSDQSDDAVSDGELSAAVDDVVTDLGRAPRRSEFDDLTEYDPQTVANRFGNGVWRDALEELGYEVSHLEEADVIPGAALRRDLRRVVDELGEVPTVREYDSLGQYSAQTIANRFGQGSWTTALEELDFDDQSGNSIALSVEALPADVERVIDELEKRPTAKEYNEHGSHSATTIANRFGGGSWLEALCELGIIHETARRDRIPDERLAADVERVIDEMGRVPTMREYTEQGEYTGTTIANRLGDGTWADALARLGYERDDGASAVDCKNRTVESEADDTTDRGEPAQ